MSHHIYILVSEVRKNWSYVGSTSNLKQRFLDHCYGKVRSTKGFRPLKLIYWEECNTDKEAYNREMYLKTGSGREEKNKIIKNHSGIV